MTPWWKRAVPRTEAVEIKGAEVNRLAAELRIVALAGAYCLFCFLLPVLQAVVVFMQWLRPYF